MRPLTGVVIDYLAGYGIEVVSSLSLEVPDNVEVGRLDPHQLVGLAKGLDLARSDAVILSACVQMPSLAVLDEAERQLSRPVLSAATATAREVLELLGEPPLVDGAGAALAGMAFAG
jgi:maleate isomerase